MKAVEECQRRFCGEALEHESEVVDLGDVPRKEESGNDDQSESGNEARILDGRTK